MLELRGVELATMLGGVRQLLDADTATVLLLDKARTALEAVATSGLGRTSRTARRIPVGAGFAGRIALTRQPYILARVTEDNVLNPLLLRHGVRSLLGVPLLVGNELLGVLHVGSFHERHFTDEDVSTLERTAAEVAAELQRRHADEEHTAALVLQRSLLPATPESISGLTMAARYIPAEGELGGDWYDVFHLDGDRVGIVMGDVVGHGLKAAVVMGRLRSALRAYALEHADPAEVLQRLDRKLSHFEHGAYATVLYGVSSAPYDRWLFSTAGHIAPLIATTGESVRQVALPADTLLGLDPNVARRTTEVELPAGGALCLFTDGLIERRPTPETVGVDEMGMNMERLIHSFSNAEEPEAACVRIIGDLVGDHIAEDDMALLVARRSA